MQDYAFKKYGLAPGLAELSGYGVFPPGEGKTAQGNFPKTQGRGFTKHEAAQAVQFFGRAQNTEYDCRT
jgi:hypothetical protein